MIHRIHYEIREGRRSAACACGWHSRPYPVESNAPNCAALEHRLIERAQP